MRYLYALLAVIALQIALEGGAQIAAQKLIPPAPPSLTVIDTELGWTYAGCRNQSYYGYGDFDLCFNSLGLRGPEITTTPVPMMILGSSVVMAQQVPEEETFAGLLGAVNAGFEGYQTHQERDRYLRDLYELEPQTLILVVTPYDLYGPAQGITEAPTGFERLLQKEGFYRLARWYGRDMPLFKDDRTARDSEYLRMAQTPLDDARWQQWGSWVRDIRDRSPESRFVIVYAAPRAEVEARQQGAAPFWLTTRLSEWCASEHIPFLDPGDALNAHPVQEVFYDYIHYTRIGHQVVADAIRGLLDSQ